MIEKQFTDMFSAWERTLEPLFTSTTSEIPTSYSAGDCFKATHVEGGDLRVDVSLAGVAPQNVWLWHSNGNVMVIKGSYADGKTFEHRYTLTSDFDVRTAAATMDNGLLRITIKPREKTSWVQVPIEAK